MHSVKYVHWQEGDWWLGYPVRSCTDDDQGIAHRRVPLFPTRPHSRGFQRLPNPGE
jgi:hypothetical protein